MSTHKTFRSCRVDYGIRAVRFGRHFEKAVQSILLLCSQSHLELVGTFADSVFADTDESSQQAGKSSLRKALLVDHEFDQAIDIGILPFELVLISNQKAEYKARTSMSLAGITSGCLKSSRASSKGHSSGGGLTTSPSLFFFERICFKTPAMSL